MKRFLIGTMFFATLGLALAGPPVDVQLVCGEGEDASLVGVATLVEDGLHVKVIDGALATCVDGVYGVIDGAVVFELTYALVDGAVTDVEVTFDAGTASVPTTYEELPEVAVEGMLGAQQNRDAARERAAHARERAPDHAGGPPTDVPRGGGDDVEEAGDEDEVEAEAEAHGGPPTDRPAPATSRR